VNTRTATFALLGVVVALALPEAASACAMCLAGQNGGTSRAFAIGSLFLSFTPLIAVGVVAWYVRRRARALAAEDAVRGERALPVARIAMQR